jgi:hypothetical protein
VEQAVEDDGEPAEAQVADEGRAHVESTVVAAGETLDCGPLRSRVDLRPDRHDGPGRVPVGKSPPSPAPTATVALDAEQAEEHGVGDGDDRRQHLVEQGPDDVAAGR